VNLTEYLKRRQARMDRLLERCIPAALKPEKLGEAMRYTLFSSGKRIRPILAIAAAEAVRGSVTPVLPFACALELIHTYSLIHDDLPAMDDDAMRRGKPTNHIVYGEALAILAGDALLTDAFRIMAEAALRAGLRQTRALQALQEIAGAAGSRGMVGGQAADIAAVRAGALLGGAGPEQLRRLTCYGEFVGLAFQLADDILDVEGAPKLTGKDSGRDQERHKATFPAVVGLAETKERAQELLVDALHELRTFGPAAEPLREIARFVVARACSS